MKKIYLFSLLLYFAVFCQKQTAAQSVLDPNDPVVEYDPSNPPVEPPYGQIGKWVRTKGVSWNTDSYKAYIYEGMCFRLKFPKTYNPAANDGKKYPLAIVFHGGGESGPITDNESQLYHGGQPYMDAVDNGTFDGYVLFPQSQGLWGNVSYTRIIDLINYMVDNNKADPFHISVNGPSSGGQACWDMVINYNTYVSSALPMSNISIGYKEAPVVNQVKFTPIWDFQGGLDGSPAASTAQQVNNAMLIAGSNYTYTEYSDAGHGTWNSAFAEPDFFPFMLRAYSSNPWVLYGRTGFCDSNHIDVTIGVAPGFNDYEWRRNGVVIAGATGNSLHVTSLGKYEARVLRGSTWSDWSHTPAIIHITPPTVTPPITISGLMSNALASGDGKNYVNLEVPDSGYTSYAWKKLGSDAVTGTERIFKAAQPGQYIAAVTEKYGCSSIYSQPFNVIDAGGSNAPDAATKLTATTLSVTEILLGWEDNPNPRNNETFFEIYRSTRQEDDYSFIGKVPADSLSFGDRQLTPGTIYYYKIRAINNNGAGLMSNIASATTSADAMPPTAPGSLKIIYTTNSSMLLQWNSSSDNVGVAKYVVYMNGVKSYSSIDTTIIINSLEQGKIYSFYVKAVDTSGNYSVQSNLVSAPAILKGLFYKYYEGSWTSLPDFDALTPAKTGVTANLTLNPKQRDFQFSFLWQGVIYAPVTGNYKFRLTSDDGSKLWLSKYNPDSIPLINNDHLNSSKSKTAFIRLIKGYYPIAVGFFQNKNNKRIQLEWSNQQFLGDADFHIIEDQYFSDDDTPAGTPPKTPDSLIAQAVAWNKIKLNWEDKGNNETAFQIYRSTKVNTDYNIVYTANSNITQFTDTGLKANTAYFYKINAVNHYGTSAFTAYVKIKTLKLGVPKPPTNIKALSLSPSSIQITWNDVDTAEINYQVFRSAVDSAHFKPAAVLPANSTSFTDTGLYGNTFYYYKVRTISIAASVSADKPARRAKTQNNPPIIAKFSNVIIPAGIQTIIPITAFDAEADSLRFFVQKLPVFATLIKNGTDTAYLILNPSSGQKGVYNNIKIKVGDGNGGQDSTIFNLTVNDNYYPLLDSINNYTMNEGETLGIPLTATDQNIEDSLSFNVTGSPTYSIVPESHGKANLVLQPGYGASGTYTIQVTVNDGNGGSATRQFNLRVNDVDPSQTVYIRFKENDPVGSPWNNVTGPVSSGFKDELDRITSVGLSLPTDWWATWHEGPQTGNNSGIYPDPVLKDYYYFGIFGGPETVTGKLTGLDASKQYRISFYAGSSWIGAENNGSTVFTVGSQSKSLAVQNNITNTADFSNIQPSTDGTVTFTMSKGNNTPVGYLNAIVVQYIYADSVKPSAPTSLIAAAGSGNGVELTWNDAAYNETAYQVYRSENATGPFILIRDGLPYNSTSYTDTSAAGNTRYYYIVKAANSSGLSDASNVAGILTPDKPPVITPVADILIKNNQQQTVYITANDDITNQIRLTVSNLPSFASFTDNGNGNGVITITPSAGTTGVFEDIKITATDNSGSGSTVSFNITVTDANMESVYINFSDGSQAPLPWNNFTAWPSPGATLSNLRNDNGSTTAASIKIMNGFQGNFAGGMQPGNNKGVYPETVMRTGFYEGGTKTDSIQVSGLDKNKKYNFVFFNSHDDGLKGNTNFTINGQTVNLNATHNINTTAAINGIIPNVNGIVMIKVAKAAGADYAYLNSLVIQGYNSSQALLAPADLRVTGKTKATASLQWADRSFDEAGFEIWRAQDTINLHYTLIASVGSNVTRYADSGLLAGHTYYYTVRAVKTDAQSAYCNPVAVTTYTQAVYVNFTFTNLAGAPWNNTAALPDIGIKWNNLMDDTGIPSSIRLEETGLFAGIYGPGTVTGNNSGVYPDKVLADCYGLFAGGSATMKLKGLNLNKKYDLTFFASANIGGDVNTSYTVNNKKVVLNASLNTDGTVTLYDVVPDDNGEAIITIAPNSIYSQFGLLGALVIQETESSTNDIPSPPQSPVSQAATVSSSKTASSLNQVNTAKAAEGNHLSVYPNPFLYNFTLSLSSPKEDEVTVQLYDVNGKPVFAHNIGRVPKGNYTVQLTPGRNLTSGVYMLKIIYRNSQKVEYMKLLKQ
ncbi:fibronectin type III domain-containing protein [Parafilimonas terrae]|uniref:PA14 domain-containing protein n=1 Tax=Parafilimonas terrae TaxID=1465490 RepID=A0A1I5Z8K9_9BACT|nr:PA14 domain-containing protein [Parafilimonas terrae]SFQ52784.1 PA14 domain-containing protein [Parafilimonas terrae]